MLDKARFLRRFEWYHICNDTEPRFSRSLLGNFKTQPSVYNRYYISNIFNIVLLK